MAYMKKMRKTKLRSKKNARKTKRIRGGASASASTYHEANGSLKMTTADIAHHEKMKDILNKPKELSRKRNRQNENAAEIMRKRTPRHFSPRYP